MRPGNAITCIVCCMCLAAGCRTAVPSAPPAAPVAVPDNCVCGGSDIEMLLAYQHTVLRMSAPALGRTLAGLNRQAPSVQTLVQKAMVLAALRSEGDLARAQGLLDQVLSSPTADAQRVKPLVVLLNANYGEWRRLDENADRLTQQLHDEQRRAEQLNDKLEALKNIERSLQLRPQPAESNPAAQGAGTNGAGIKNGEQGQ